MVEMFIKLLSLNNPNKKGSFQDPNSLLDVILEVITDEELSQLIENMTFQEIKDSMFSLGAFKALGPDGFPPTFFQDH